MMVALAIGRLVYTLMLVFVFGLCKAAGKADELIATSRPETAEQTE